MSFKHYEPEELLSDLYRVADSGCECPNEDHSCAQGEVGCWPGRFERAARTILDLWDRCRDCVR